jgi:hypothetical protein
VSEYIDEKFHSRLILEAAWKHHNRQAAAVLRDKLGLSSVDNEKHMLHLELTLYAQWGTLNLKLFPEI